MTFADATTVVKAQDRRLDVHKNIEHLNIAMGIIQANSKAKDKTIKDFIGGSTGSHEGTHQIIGEKIKFGLGNVLDIGAVASVIEDGAVGGDIFANQSATGDTTASTSSQSIWNWSTENSQYYRQKSDGASEWWVAPKMGSQTASDARTDGEWTWSSEHQRHYRFKADGKYEWFEELKKKL